MIQEYQQDCFSPTALFSPIEIRDWFKVRIASGEPASLIRLGDGEFAWLGYDLIAPWEHTSRSLNIWFGHDKFSHKQLLKTASQLRGAVRAATVIGIPRASRQRSEVYCQYAYKIFAHYKLARPEQFYTDCGVHRFWQMLLAYRDLLQGLPFVGIVTSKDIGGRLAEVFGIKKVALYPIPSERGQAPGDFDNLGSHYPECFEQLCDELSVPYRGAVFLIGAGALGKIYADIIYKRGGIALDVGSIIDGWVGVGSRRFLIDEPGMFSLESYRATSNLQPEEILDRYRNLLRQVLFGSPPTDEESILLERYSPYPVQNQRSFCDDFR